MGDVGEDFRALKESRTEKKVKNLERSTELLNENNIIYSSKNGGTHLIITHHLKIADFWPSTGKYKIRGQNKYKRGVFNLLNELGVRL